MHMLYIISNFLYAPKFGSGLSQVDILKERTRLIVQYGMGGGQNQKHNKHYFSSYTD